MLGSFFVLIKANNVRLIGQRKLKKMKKFKTFHIFQTEEEFTDGHTFSKTQLQYSTMESNYSGLQQYQPDSG